MQVETIFGVFQRNFMNSLCRQKLFLVDCSATISMGSLHLYSLFLAYYSAFYEKSTQVRRASDIISWHTYYIWTKIGAFLLNLSIGSETGGPWTMAGE